MRIFGPIETIDKNWSFTVFCHARLSLPIREQDQESPENKGPNDYCAMGFWRADIRNYSSLRRLLPAHLKRFRPSVRTLIAIARFHVISYLTA
jgi:hypothetical protein